MLQLNQAFFFYAIFTLTATLSSSISCMKDARIDTSKLSYLPTEQPINDIINDIRRKLIHVKPEEIETICPSIKCIKMEKPGERKGVCYNVAMKHSLKLTKKELATLKIVGCQDWIGNLNVLESFYEQTNTPTGGTLAIYSNSLDNNEALHAGIVNHNGTIRSKLATERGIYDHPTWYLQANWGDQITYWNLRNKFNGEQGRKLLLNELQDKVTADTGLQEQVTLHQQRLLRLSCQNDSTIETIYTLLKQVPCIDINIQDTTNNETPLMLASRTGSLDKVILFVVHKADINLKNNDGKTALHLAAENNHFRVMRYLLDHGANPEIKDNNGKTANIPFFITHAKPLFYSTATFATVAGSLSLYYAYKYVTSN